MRLHEVTPSPSPVSDLYEALCQKSVREQACRRSGALSWNIDIDATEAGARIVVERVLPPEVPDMVRKFVGDSITVRQEEVWGPAAPDGARTASLQVTIQGQPASMSGRIDVAASDNGSIQTVDGDVKVTIPFLGKMVEPEIAKVIVRALQIEQAAGQEWLDSRA